MRLWRKKQSNQRGKCHELSKYRLEYMTADEDAKSAIKFTIQHSFVNIDRSKLSASDQKFLKEIYSY